MSQAIQVETVPGSLERGPADHLISDLTRQMTKADESAYRQFFALYQHRLFRYLLVLTRGQEELATELLQQTMIKVARHIRVFAEEAALWRWLTLLARTSAIDESRKSRRFFSFIDRFRFFTRGRSPEPPPAIPNTFDSVFAEQLERLAPEERSLLEKKYLEGLSVTEIAAAFNTTEKAIESRLSRTRAKLKTNVLDALSHEDTQR